MTIEEMNLLAELILTLRKEEDEANRIKKDITAKLEKAENEMLLALQGNDMTSYRSPSGLCSVSFRTSVRTPKTLEEKEAFYSFLKEKGYYDDLISVNSQKLNGFYKEQMELAKERGDEDFEIPGIKEVTMTPNLSFRRA